MGQHLQEKELLTIKHLKNNETIQTQHLQEKEMLTIKHLKNNDIIREKVKEKAAKKAAAKEKELISKHTIDIQELQTKHQNNQDHQKHAMSEKEKEIQSKNKEMNAMKKKHQDVLNQHVEKNKILSKKINQHQTKHQPM